MPGSWMSSHGTCPGEVLTLSNQAISYQSWGGRLQPHAVAGEQWGSISKALSWRTRCDEELRGVCVWGHGQEPSLSSLQGPDGFIFQHSIIQGTNQDGFIQRAIDASNAYASIIEAVRKAERAAHDADEAASEALMVRAVGSPRKLGQSHTPSTVLQLVTSTHRTLLPFPSET